MDEWTHVNGVEVLEARRHVLEYSLPIRPHQHDAVILNTKTNTCSLIRSLITICRAHCVENVESEALEAVARWSVIGKIVSF